MKKIIILIIALIGFSKVYAGGTVETNNVCFHGYKIKSFTYYYPSTDSKWYSITDGEKFEDVSISFNDNSCLIVHASRKLSKTPIEFVQSAIEWDARNMVGLFYGRDKDVTPKELSFAIGVNLSLAYGEKRYTCSGVILGQGGNGAGSHDWWIFSTNGENNQSLTCTDDIAGEQIYMYPDANSRLNHYIFKLTTSTPPKK